MNNQITQNKNSQEALSPQDAIQMLKVGNERFVNSNPLNRDLKKQIDENKICSVKLIMCH